MKICPFLVAGQDSMSRGRDSAAWRDAAGSARHSETAGQAEEQAEVQKATSTQLWAIDREHEEAPSALECLGEPCRFYHAGGCRFDGLFTGNGGSSEVSGSATQSLLRQEGNEEGPSLGSVLQEVWSLQRESLKEMIGGFRNLEGSQKQQQGNLRSQLDELATRLQEARNSNPELQGIVEERFAALLDNVTALEKVLQTSLGSSAADMKSALETTHDALAEVREDTSRNLQEGFETTQGILRESREATQQLLREERDETQKALQEEGKETRRLLQEGREQTLEDLAATRRALQQKHDAIPQLLRDALDETREQLRELVAQNSSESRAELERTLQRVLEDNRHMQELRDELRQSLQTLTDHVRQVTDAAGTLEGTSRRAEELLAEQRDLSEALLQRERHEEARRLNNAGVMAYHEGAFDSSVTKFQKALELDPSLTEAWNNLGLSFTEMRQDDEALEAFKKSIELDPKGGQVYNNLGYLYHRRGELEQAVEMYERATQRTQDTSAAWSNLGNALYEMRRADEALKAWKRALELDPTNDKASRALERLGLETNG